LYGCVVLFQTESDRLSLYLLHNRRSLLTVTQGDNKPKIMTLRIEKHINAGTSVRLTDC